MSLLLVLGHTSVPCSFADGTAACIVCHSCSREMYDKWQAQKWWGDNNERIMELYNVRRFSRQVLPTPPRSDDAEVSRCLYPCRACLLHACLLCLIHMHVPSHGVRRASVIR